MEGLSVGEVARRAGVSVRTLHHWDAVGLLVPSGRTAAGYRVYSDGDLERLRGVLTYRALGFSLEDVAALLDDPAVDALGHLRRQHALLTDRIAHLQAVAAQVARAVEARSMGIELDPQEHLEVFGDADPSRYAEEAEQRWGDTDAWEESQRRTRSYGKAEWQQAVAEGQDVERRFAALLAAGVPAAAPEAQEAVEAHRAHISRWYYECTPEVQRGLAELYVSDERFTAHYERIAPGLAQYVADAITA